MKTALLIVSIICLMAHTGSSQVKPIQFDQLEARIKEEKRPVMVLIGTSWCKYCQMMQRALLKPSRVSAVAAQDFYTVFLDAEMPSEITFAGKSYSYKPAGVNTGVHTLAEKLATINGRMVYPTLCFLNENLEVIYRHQGYVDSETWIYILKRISSK